ncbi:oxidoreductase [Dyadobacter sp. 3J3]|uniref:oxidoreductase n=1 Tax=Dyadobacter sp. 3J3 TaxID=2606600 RepID=UPI00135894AD|nr:oxidoreductase [Dyadobacter sp. 3J3]
MRNQKVWFITAAARGLGFEITKAVLASGDKVIATVRNNPKELETVLNNDNLHVINLDVTDGDGAKTAVAQAIEQFGRIDVLLNNAGFGLLSGVEEGSDAEIRKMFNTNVFGTLNVIRAILPYQRNQRSGHIINISSVGGLKGSAGWGLYSATKFAVEGFSEALYNELLPLGIHVSLVEPGYFRTNFLDGSSLNVSKNIIEDYTETVGKMRKFAAAVSYNQPGDPKKLAAAIIKLAASAEPPLHLPLGSDSLKAYQAKTAAFQKDIDAWKDVITGTDFDDN